MEPKKLVYPVAVIVVVCCVIWWCVWPCWLFPTTTTVLLVRHAEKSGSPPGDPLLTAEGEARAADLAHVAANAGVTAIFVTNYIRTQRTAEDLANDLGLTPQIPGGSPQDLANLILANHRGETVVVVGHSDTVPEIIDALDGETMPGLPGNEYDRFFVVTVPRCGPVKTLELQYGEPSP
jgi:broad specificity phosphatase PhoE